MPWVPPTQVFPPHQAGQIWMFEQAPVLYLADGGLNARVIMKAASLDIYPDVSITSWHTQAMEGLEEVLVVVFAIN
jgi:hypothetical protein